MSYTNTFYNKHNQNSREVYEDDPDKIIYKDHEIHKRSLFEYHIVRRGKCIGIYAGINGAKGQIDKLIEKK